MPCCALLAAAALAIVVTTPLPVAAAEYRFDVWTTDQGLPQNTVNDILQSRDGYLWFTTFDGLVRFDGIRFTIFDKHSAGLATNRLSRLFEDRRGDLWIGTENGGVIRYSGGRFVSYGIDEGLPDTRVIAINEDAAGHILVHTGRGVARWRNGQFVPPAIAYPAPFTLGVDRELLDELWYTDAAGLHRFTRGQAVTYTRDTGLTTFDIVSVKEDQRGVLWVATRHAGLHRIENGQAWIFGVKEGLPADIHTAQICEDRAGNLWMPAPGGALARLHGGTFTTYGPAQGFTNDRIRTIYEDREGNIWIGTFSQGLIRVRHQPITVYTEDEGLSHRNVYPILEDRAGTIWIGTQGGGLTKYAGGTFTRVPTERDRPSITALYEDRDGALWVAEGDAILQWKDGAFRTVYTDPSLHNQSVRVLHRDRRGTLWFGADNGLRRYKDGVVTLYTTKDGLASNDVRAIHEDRAGTLWFGSDEGLTKLEAEKFRVVIGPGSGQSLPHVRAIHEDRDERGLLWIGTYDSGLGRLKNGTLTRYTTADGLHSNGAFQILEDRHGRLWMSSNRGIYRVKKQDLNAFANGHARAIVSVAYGREDGLVTIECNGGQQPAGIQRRDGTLWFPTQRGVAVIDPDTLPSETGAPSVSLEGGLLERQPIDPTRTLRILPGQTDLEIHYTAPTFTKPEQVRFRYKLIGLESDWVDAGTRRTAYYPHLPPGDYTFRVVAAAADGSWSAEGASLAMTVVPPFWQTWWFNTIALLGVIGGGMLVYERRIRQLRRAHEARAAFSRQLIDSQEGERKRIAAELHDSLSQNLLIIKNRALLGADAMADDGHAAAREQFDEIATSATAALDEVRHIAYDLRPFHLDRLGLTSTIGAMVERVSAATETVVTVDIEELDGLLSKDAEVNLYRILQEAVNNTVKHAQATRASIRIRRWRNELRVAIQDNGRGFAADALHPGLGLNGIAERVRILGGTHSIRSLVGLGTTISIGIPLPATDTEAPRDS